MCTAYNYSLYKLHDIISTGHNVAIEYAYGNQTLCVILGMCLGAGYTQYHSLAVILIAS